MRTCGRCQLCCKIFPLPVLDKPADVCCKFASAAGCAVYREGQPEVCRQYACYWLEHEDLPDRLRPDRIGIVVTECGTITIGDDELPVLVLNQSTATAAQSPAAKAFIDGLTGRGMVAMLICGPDLDIVYDRVRYAAISPQDIEAAFRRQRSADAAELKRLGAVSDSWSPHAIDDGR
jgi:hypothetical protein